MTKRIPWYWLALIGVLLLSRLSALEVALLTPAEARAALTAQHAATAGVWPAAVASPLLLMGNALLFLLFGPGSGIARLLPALAGTLLVGMPWFWQDALPVSQARAARGQFGAWSAAALLTLSPIALYVSRQVDGAALGALGGALVLTALFTMNDQPRRESWLLGTGLALGLTGGPAFYDVLLPGLLAWGARHWVEERKPTLARFHWRALALGLLAALLLSIGLGWRWNGWAGPVEGLAAWWQEWRHPATARANPLLLLLYEPLLLVLAAVGFGLTLRQRTAVPLTLAIWALLALLLASLRPGATPNALIAPLLPLALLGGWAVQQLVRPRRFARGGWMEWLHAALGLVLWFFIALVLLRQASAPHNANGLELPLVLLVLLIHLLTAAGFVSLIGPRRAFTGALLGLVAALCLLQLSFGMGAAFVRAGDPAEPLTEIGVSGDLRNLRRTLEDLRLARALSPDTLVLTAIENDPTQADTWAVLRWALQPLTVQSVITWPETAPELVLTLTNVQPPEQLQSAYRGIAFGVTLQNGGPLPGCEAGVVPPVCTYPLAWYFFRRTPIAPAIQHVILWAKMPATP